jgi:hypothetical protein
VGEFYDPAIASKRHHFFSGGCTALDLIRFKAFWAKVLTLSIARRSAPSSGERVVSEESCLSESFRMPLRLCADSVFRSLSISGSLKRFSSQVATVNHRAPSQRACSNLDQQQSVPLFSFAHAGVVSAMRAAYQSPWQILSPTLDIRPMRNGLRAQVVILRPFLWWITQVERSLSYRHVTRRRSRQR